MIKFVVGVAEGVTSPFIPQSAMELEACQPAGLRPLTCHTPEATLNPPKTTLCVAKLELL